MGPGSHACPADHAFGSRSSHEALAGGGLLLACVVSWPVHTLWDAVKVGARDWQQKQAGAHKLQPGYSDCRAARSHRAAPGEGSGRRHV